MVCTSEATCSFAPVHTTSNQVFWARMGGASRCRPCDQSSFDCLASMQGSDYVRFDAYALTTMNSLRKLQQMFLQVPQESGAELGSSVDTG